MRIVCLSDTHNRHERVRVPDGDLLIHAGDFTVMGRPEEIVPFDRWLATLPHHRKIVIAGNHEFLFERHPDEARRLITHAIYLQDSGTVVDGLHVWGSPWQPEFGDLAFNLPRGDSIAQKWRLNPDGTDILVTHGPPYGQNDALKSGRRVGCQDLMEAIRRIRPRLHVGGHIHQAHGESRVDGTHFINASICNESYEPVNAPIVVDV